MCTLLKNLPAFAARGAAELNGVVSAAIG